MKSGAIEPKPPSKGQGAGAAYRRGRRRIRMVAVGDGMAAGCADSGTGAQRRQLHRASAGRGEPSMIRGMRSLTANSARFGDALMLLCPARRSPSRTSGIVRSQSRLTVVCHPVDHL